MPDVVFTESCKQLDRLFPLPDLTVERKGLDPSALRNAHVVFVVGGPGSGKGTQVGMTKYGKKIIVFYKN